jgi:hypothetical protein
MRADMGKVLVERPRLRTHSGYSGVGKGYAKQVQKCLDSGDPPPRREGMKTRYGKFRKFFNENLAPLRRFLDSNVGRPWDKVYAEICQHVDRGNVVQKHVLTHLFDYVVTNVILIDGQPCRGEGGWRYGDSLRTSDRYHCWYVCPKSGLLRRSRHMPRVRKRPEPPRRVVLNKSQMCLFLGGQWELVTVAPLPGLTSQHRAFDVILKRHMNAWGGDSAASRFYGATVYAVARRPLSRRELLAMPIPVEWLS